MPALRPRAMPAGFVEPCIPTAARVPPAGPSWLHEIKDDGYRLIGRLEGRKVRLFSRRGHDLSDRFPRIREALASLRARSATIDGEAVVLCAKTGLSLFDELHSGRRDRDVILYAFDLIELNGKDQRGLALEERKAREAGYVSRRLRGRHERAFPVLRPARAVLARLPLGPGPSLHRLRCGSLRFVRRLHRYYGRV